MTPVDWTIFDKYPENTVECRCGAIYRSHTKATYDDGQFRLHSRKPCPLCGASMGNARCVSSDPEEFVIGKEDA